MKATMLQPGEKLPGLTYKQAGVDIAAGDELVERIKKMNKKGDIGGFGGKVPFGDSFLVAGTDGVGTKLKLAFELNRHSTVGIDLVAMSVNDIITLGAKPMFFLDYFATGALDVDTAEQVPLDLDLGGVALADALMEPTTIYVKAMLELLQAKTLHGMAHITGGGLKENIIRVVPDGLGIALEASAIVLPPCSIG
ncbi:MAG: hypothetical protein WDW38_001460 [Sanguina aurantia]